MLFVYEQTFRSTETLLLLFYPNSIQRLRHSIGSSKSITPGSAVFSLALLNSGQAIQLTMYSNFCTTFFFICNV